MKNLVLVFVIAFAFCTTAMASDIAISTQAGWFGQGAADREMQEIADNVTAVSVEQFTANEQDALADWVVAHTGDGVSDLLILCGQFPDTIYAPGNAQADDSLAELFLDDGNCIVNTGDYMFYVVNGAGTNGEGGIRAMMDIAGITMWDDDTAVVVTAEGQDITPSLVDYATDRPFHLDELEGDWEAELILAQNAAGTRADPVIVVNLDTGGRLGIFYQTSGQDNDPRGEVISEWINNWYLTNVAAGKPRARRPDPSDGAMLADTWVSLSWRAGDFAVSHDVYLGDNFDDVNDGAESTFQGNQAGTNLVIGFLGFPYPDGLVPGTTYYWRIDEVNDTDPNSPWKGSVWSFWIPPYTAYNPSPADGAKFVVPDAELNWMPGFLAKLHTVYFGDNFDDVNNAVVGIPSAHNTYNPGTLELEKTYYWRVDEFDGFATHKGDVWSFSTIPDIAITDPSLVGWWKLDEGEHSTTAVDWSGHDNHGTLRGDPQWVSGYDGIALELDGSGDYVDLGNPSDWSSGTSARSMCGWGKTDSVAGGWRWIAAYGSEGTSLAMFIGMNGTSLYGGGYGDDVLEADFWEVDVWHHICLTYDGTTARLYADGVNVTSEAKDWNLTLSRAHIGRQVNDLAEFWNGLVDDVRIYNKALTLEEIKQAMRGDPLLAGVPKPSNGSTPYIRDATPLSWSPGDSASGHDVYFGTDRDAVADADESDTTGIYRGRQGVTIYTPPDVEWGGGPYYWRVDEYNTDGTISKGSVWSFTVIDFIGIDDIEDYNDYPPDEIFSTWIDGWEVPTNGSLAGHADPPFAETGNVHGGSQSMPVYYENNFKYSEITMTLVSVRDWTEEGVGVLSLWFYGDASNAAERMYVNLNGIAVVYHNDPSAALIDTWTEWTIDLQEFAAQGVNLANVNTISIGFGDKSSLQAGGSGLVFFDDIRLYR